MRTKKTKTLHYAKRKNLDSSGWSIEEILGGFAKIPNFDLSGDTNKLGIRWTRWLRSFELYAAGQGVMDAEQEYVLMLHRACLSVQDVFFTMTIPDPTGEDTVYSILVSKLNENFLP